MESVPDVLDALGKKVTGLFSTTGLVDSYVANSILTQVPTYSVTEEQHLLAELRCAVLPALHRW